MHKSRLPPRPSSSHYSSFFQSKLPQNLVHFLLSAPAVYELLAIDPVFQFNNELIQRFFPLPRITTLELFDLFDTFYEYETAQFSCFSNLEALTLSFVEVLDLKGNVDHLFLVGLNTVVLRHYTREA